MVSSCPWTVFELPIHLWSLEVEIRSSLKCYCHLLLLYGTEKSLSLYGAWHTSTESQAFEMLASVHTSRESIARDPAVTWKCQCLLSGFPPTMQESILIVWIPIHLAPASHINNCCFISMLFVNLVKLPIPPQEHLKTSFLENSPGIIIVSLSCVLATYTKICMFQTLIVSTNKLITAVRSWFTSEGI